MDIQATGSHHTYGLYSDSSMTVNSLSGTVSGNAGASNASGLY